jgi:hypothetical protein
VPWKVLGVVNYQGIPSNICQIKTGEQQAVKTQSSMTSPVRLTVQTVAPSTSSTWTSNIHMVTGHGCSLKTAPVITTSHNGNTALLMKTVSTAFLLQISCIWSSK